MPIPNTFGAGVGLVDKAALDANFTAVSTGASSSPQNNLTAHAGGGQAAALALSGSTRYRVTTVATAGDSVSLPLAASQALVIINASANSMNVYASLLGTDTINGTAGTTAYALAAGKVAEFFSAGAGVWNTLLSA
jgi:hypothetical protein